MSRSAVVQRVAGAASSPFDHLRHEDAGGEFWYARELMVVMGYSQWRDFYVAVDRAMESLSVVQGMEAVARHFADIRNREQAGITGNVRLDFRLTRFAAYLTAMAGDGRKEQVAGARVYFAVKTREAEVAAAPALPDRMTPELLEQWARDLRERDHLAAQVEEQRKAIDWALPRAQYVDTFADPAGLTSIRDFAKQIGLREHAVRAWLQEHRITYRDANGEWRPYAGYAKHFSLKDQESIEHRNPDGTVHQTLMLNAPGKVWLAARLAKAGLPPAPSWDR
jgi:DNA-damage-inducible protein D